MDHLNKAREGMRVMDANGNDIGTVESLKMGDPAAATAAGQRVDQGGGIVTALARGLSGEPDVPNEEAERLLRVGYIRVDRKGPFTGRFYVPADRVVRITDDTVHVADE